MHTLDELKKHLNYNPDTGIFTWKPGGRKRKHGSIAGTLSNGYVYIYLQGNNYAAHRLAWLFVYSEWPKQFIDHINGTRSDNRILNLRDVSHAQNLQGARNLSPRSTTGYTGVYWDKKLECFTSSRMRNGKTAFLGCFDTAEAAHAAYVTAGSATEPADLTGKPKTYRPRRKSLQKPAKSPVFTDLPSKLQEKLKNSQFCADFE